MRKPLKGTFRTANIKPETPQQSASSTLACFAPAAEHWSPIIHAEENSAMGTRAARAAGMRLKICASSRRPLPLKWAGH